MAVSGSSITANATLTSTEWTSWREARVDVEHELRVGRGGDEHVAREPVAVLQSPVAELGSRREDEVDRLRVAAHAEPDRHAVEADDRGRRDRVEPDAVGTLGADTELDVREPARVDGDRPHHRVRLLVSVAVVDVELDGERRVLSARRVTGTTAGFGVAGDDRRGPDRVDLPERVSSRYAPSWNRSLRTSVAAVDGAEVVVVDPSAEERRLVRGRIADEPGEHRPELGHADGRELGRSAREKVGRAIREGHDPGAGRGRFLVLVSRDGRPIQHRLTGGVEIDRRSLGPHADLLEHLGAPRDREGRGRGLSRANEEPVGVDTVERGVDDAVARDQVEAGDGERRRLRGECAHQGPLRRRVPSEVDEHDRVVVGMPTSVDVVDESLPQRRGPGDHLIADLGVTRDPGEHVFSEHDVVESAVFVGRQVTEIRDRETERPRELADGRFDATLHEDPELVVLAGADRGARAHLARQPDGHRFEVEALAACRLLDHRREQRAFAHQAAHTVDAPSRCPLRDPVAEAGEDGPEHGGSDGPVAPQRRGEVGRRAARVEPGPQGGQAPIAQHRIEGRPVVAVVSRTFAAQHLVETGRAQRQVQRLEPVLPRGFGVGDGVVADVQHAVARDAEVRRDDLEQLGCLAGAVVTRGEDVLDVDVVDAGRRQELLELRRGEVRVRHRDDRDLRGSGGSHELGDRVVGEHEVRPRRRAPPGRARPAARATWDRPARRRSRRASPRGTRRRGASSPVRAPRPAHVLRRTAPASRTARPAHRRPVGSRGARTRRQAAGPVGAGGCRTRPPTARRCRPGRWP